MKSAGSEEVDSGEASRNIKASELLSYPDLVAFSVAKDSDPRACYALINGDTEIEVEFRRVEYPVRSVADEIREAGLPEGFANALLTGGLDDS